MKTLPEARLAVKRNRLKMYDQRGQSGTPVLYGNSYYLKNKQEYEIELFNPTQGDVLVKIHIENKNISDNGGGVILRPGERIFLERFLKNNRKFMFDSYEVGTSQAVKNAIKKNGDIKIEFFQETFFNNLISGSTTSSFTYPSTFTFGTCTTDSLGFNELDNSMGSLTTSASDTTTSFDSTRAFYSSSVPISAEPAKTTKSFTGKTAEGSASNQDFETVYNKTWSYVADVTYEFKLLPVENKPVLVKDLHRVHCTECGNRIKKGWKFCAGCGEKC